MARDQTITKNGMIVFLKRFVNKKDYFLSIIFALLISVDAFVMP